MTYEPSLQITDEESPHYIQQDYYRDLNNLTPNSKSYSSNNSLNEDLIHLDFSGSFRSESSTIPIIDTMGIEGIEEMMYSARDLPISNIVSKKVLYFLLEMLASSLFYTSIFCNSIIVSSVEYSIMETDKFHIFSYIIIKLLNFINYMICMYIFTTPDTYKSIGIFIELIIVNAICFEYTFIQIAKYASIYILSVLISSWIVIGIFYEIINDTPSGIVLRNTIPWYSKYDFTYSFLMAVVIANCILNFGLTLMTKDTNSINAKNKSFHKAFLVLLVSITYGSIIEPIGYAFPNLLFYTNLLIVKKETDQYNYKSIVLSSSSICLLVVIYPVMSVFVINIIRKKYLRYIEYHR